MFVAGLKRSKLSDLQEGGDLTLKSWAPQGACGFDSRPRHLMSPSGMGEIPRLKAKPLGGLR